MVRAAVISFKSWPEQNTGPVAANTTTRTLESSAASVNATDNRASMSVDSALRRLLSFKVSLRTPSVNSLSKMSLSACPVIVLPQS